MNIIYTTIVPIALALWVYYDARKEERSWLWALGVFFLAPIFFIAYFWTKEPELIWQCPNCEYENSATTQTCENCGIEIDDEKQKEILRGRWKMSDVVAIILLSQLVSMFIFMWESTPTSLENLPRSAEEILETIKPSTVWLAQLFASNVMLGLSLYCITSRYKWNLSEIGLKFDKPARYLLIAVGLTAAFIVFQQVFINLAIEIGEMVGIEQIKKMFLREMEKQQEGWPEDFSEPIFPLMFFTAVILVPVSEEILFRGMTYTALKERFGKHGGMLLSAFIFALLHQMVYYFFLIFLMGLVFAYIYERTQSLLPSIFSHVLINLSAVIMVMR